MMYAAIGFIVSTLLVALGRITYVYLFERELFSLAHLLSISTLQQFIYLAVILIGTFNTHKISRHRSFNHLIAEFLGTFIFAFFINFINR